MNIDCELYNRGNCVVVALHTDPFQDHAHKDFLVGSLDLQRSTISFFTFTILHSSPFPSSPSSFFPLDSEGTKDPAVERDSIDQQPVIRDQSSVSGATTALTESNPSPVTELSTFAVPRDSAPVEATTSRRPRVCFKVLLVRATTPGSDKQLTTYAFLDSGSDTTLCLKSLVEELSLESEPTDFTLLTVNYEGKKHGRRARLDIEALHKVYSTRF